jgi:hypothetical protein
LTEWYESEEVTNTLNKFVQGHLSQTWEERIANLRQESEYEATNDGYGVGESSMALAAAAAFGRYGKHGTTTPAVRLSKTIVQRYSSSSRSNKNRVLFCRDGQSAMQLAVRMGMGQFQVDQPYLSTSECVVCAPQGSNLDLEYTTVQFDVPTLSFQDGGVWCVSSSSSSDRSLFETKEEAFDIESRMSETNTFLQYKVAISREWEELEKICQIGSVMVTLSASEIEFVDPLWHRALWDIAKSKSVPFIVDDRDESITGWQDAMGCDPDLVISEVGGVGPLGVVVAGEGISDKGVGEHSFTPSATESVSAMHALEQFPRENKLRFK